MNLSIKNRVSIYYTVATAVAMAAVFVMVYLMVRTIIFRNIDQTLSDRVVNQTVNVTFEKGRWRVSGEEEPVLTEVKGLGADQVQLCVINMKGRIVHRSANSGEIYLIHDSTEADGKPFTRYRRQGYMRQFQQPIHSNGELAGYVVGVSSLESTFILLTNLGLILFVSYLIIVVGLFFFSRYLAGTTIKPVRAIRDTADRITRDSLNARVPLPVYHDEVYDLSVSINQLLQRVEDALLRERQFSSYVSHELRTPLSVLRGTLEVLIRKPRAQQEYEQKISDSLREVDKLTEVMEQLLMLARADGAILFASDRREPLADVVEEIVAAKALEAELYGVELSVKYSMDQMRLVPRKHVELILNNLIGNAIKYGSAGKKVMVDLRPEDGNIHCRVSDQGPGIAQEDLSNIFKPFYRSRSTNSGFFKGNGLGLAIAHKTAHAIGAEIKVESELKKGSTFTLVIYDGGKTSDGRKPKSPKRPPLAIEGKA